MKLTKFISHYSELYAILYELYKMRHANASKQKSWMDCYSATVTEDRPPLRLGPSVGKIRDGFQKRFGSVYLFRNVLRTVRYCTADCLPYKGRLGSRNAPFLCGIWKWTADRPRVNGGPSAIERTGKQFSAMFLVVWMCKWRTVRKNSETHRRGRRRQVLPRLWLGFVPKDF